MSTLARRALPLALSGALVAGALAVPVLAQDADPTGPDTAEEQSDDDVGPGPRGSLDDALHGIGHLHRGLPEDVVTDLAEELGITTDELEAALDAVAADHLAERLDEAVDAGRLTEDQAERLRAAAEAGELAEVGREVFLEHLAARLDERVAADDLTREEADEILADAEAGELRDRSEGRRAGHDRRGGPGSFGGGPAADTTSSQDDAVAEATSV